MADETAQQKTETPVDTMVFILKTNLVFRRSFSRAFVLKHFFLLQEEVKEVEKTEEVPKTEEAKTDEAKTETTEETTEKTETEEKVKYFLVLLIMNYYQQQ